MLTQLTKGVLSKTGPFSQTKHWDEQTEIVLYSAYFGIQTICSCYIAKNIERICKNFIKAYTSLSNSYIYAPNVL